MGPEVDVSASEGGSPCWCRMEKPLLWLKGCCYTQIWLGEIGATSLFVGSCSTFANIVRGSV